MLLEFDIELLNLLYFVVLKEWLSEERMRNLYNICNVYIFLERGKGWDLLVMEVMVMGKFSIGINWSVNREFMNFDNFYLIELIGEIVFVEEDLVENLNLYVGYKWFLVNEDDVVKMMKWVYKVEEEN